MQFGHAVRTAETQSWPQNRHAYDDSCRAASRFWKPFVSVCPPYAWQSRFIVCFPFLHLRLDMLSSFELKHRASRFEQQSADKVAKDVRKQEKERLLRERIAARRRAHEQAAEELRARQAHEAEQVRVSQE